MARILLLKGQSQYDVLRIFIDEIAKGFQKLKNETVIIDLVEKNYLDKIDNEVRKGCDFVFSFNANGIDIKLGNESIYDAINIPFFTILVDHPLYHNERLNFNVKNLILGCIDYTHMEFIKKYYPNIKNVCFVPHGGIEERNTGNIEHTNGVVNISNKDKDIIFAGTYFSPDEYRNEWLNFPEFISKFMNEMSDRLLYNDENIGLEQCFEEVINSRGIYFSLPILSDNKATMLYLIDRYIRAVRRYTVIKKVTESGLKLHCYGNGFEGLGFSNKNLIINKSLGVLDLLDTMKKSKIVLNVMPNFPNGSHERIFTTMLNNSLCLTDSNMYINDNFKNGKNILTYTWKDIDLLPDIINNTISNNSIMENITLNGKIEAAKYHTWKHRAEKIMNIYYLYKILN